MEFLSHYLVNKIVLKTYRTPHISVDIVALQNKYTPNELNLTFKKYLVNCILEFYTNSIIWSGYHVQRPNPKIQLSFGFFVKMSIPMCQ